MSFIRDAGQHRKRAARLRHLPRPDVPLRLQASRAEREIAAVLAPALECLSTPALEDGRFLAAGEAPIEDAGTLGSVRVVQQSIPVGDQSGAKSMIPLVSRVPSPVLVSKSQMRVLGPSVTVAASVVPSGERTGLE
jgi:hypothetical protein